MIIDCSKMSEAVQSADVMPDEARTDAIGVEWSRVK
jgi:hypothetical protein